MLKCVYAGLAAAMLFAGGAAAAQSRPAPPPSIADALAQTVQRVAAAAPGGGWTIVRAAFPNARWNPHERFNPPLSDGQTDLLTGHAMLGGIRHGINAHGAARGPASIEFDAGLPHRVDLAALRRAMTARGLDVTLLGCDNGYAAWSYRSEGAPSAYLRIAGRGGDIFFQLSRTADPTRTAQAGRYTSYAIFFALPLTRAQADALDPRHCG